MFIIIAHLEDITQSGKSKQAACFFLKVLEEFMDSSFHFKSSFAFHSSVDIDKKMCRQIRSHVHVSTLYRFTLIVMPNRVKDADINDITADSRLLCLLIQLEIRYLM